MSASRGRLAHLLEPMDVATWTGRPLEEEIEAGLVRRLGSIPDRIVERQVDCCGNRPDIVLVWGRVLTIVEVKRDVIGQRAIEQLDRYVGHWIDELADLPDHYTVFGILAAPALRPAVAEDLTRRGFGFQLIRLRHRAAA